MNEFEKTRQQIEEIKRQAEERKLALEKEKLGQEEEKRKEAEKAEALRQARERGLLAAKEQASKLLQKVNTEFFSGKGIVVSWKETSSKLHTHYWSETGHFDGDIMSSKWSFTRTHKTKQLETRLKIPNHGDIVVFIPLVDQRGHKDHKRKNVYTFDAPVFLNKSIIVSSSTSPEKDIVCSWGHKSEVDGIPLELPEDELIKQLEEEILHQVVSFHKKALGV